MAEKLAEIARGASVKWPPTLENDSSYENWKKDIEIWSKLTDLKPGKQALAIHLSLTGKARVATSELGVDELGADDGVKKILEKLDTLFLLDKGIRQFMAYRDIFNFMKRDESKGIVEHISGFEHLYYKFKTEGMTLPDTVMAFMLIVSCELDDQDIKLVMNSIGENITYEKAKAVLKRTFCSGINKTPSVVKTEVFLGESEDKFAGDRSGADSGGNDVYYSNVRGRTMNRGRFRGSRRSSGQFLRFRGASRGRTDYEKASPRRQNNPVGPDGQVSRCRICDSRFHWARQCPDSYESIENGLDGDGNSDRKSSDEQLTLFVAYTNDENSCEKVNNLVRESYGCGLLDTGCMRTVAGSEWIQNYIESLTTHDRMLVTEVPSSASFTFGDGRSYRSVKSVTLPCCVGGIRGTITTEVVTASIPLLFSKTSMKKAKMQIDVGNDVLRLRDKSIKLSTSNTGHYMLDLNI